MKKTIRFTITLIILLLVAGCEFTSPITPSNTGNTPNNDFTINTYFQDNMILKQREDFMIDGISENGVLIKASLYDSKGYLVKQTSALADINGEFRLTITAPKASFDKYSLVITDTVHEHTIKQIMFGEVWLFAGEKTVPKTNTDELLNNNNIRFLKYINGELTWTDASEKSLYDVTKDVATKLYASLNLPIALIDATLDSGYADSWLEKETALKHKVISNYLTSIDRLTDTSNIHYNTDELGAMYQTYLANLEGISISGIIWSQGQSDFKNILPDNYNKTVYTYAYLISQLFAGKVFKNKDFDLFTIQESYLDEPYANVLRNAQAVSAYQLNNMMIIPTYDLIKVTKDLEDSEQLTFQYDAYINRISDVVINVSYNNMKSYQTPSYVNVVANKDLISIAFSSYHTLQKVEQIEGLVVLDANGNEIAYEFEIVNNYLYLDLLLEEEQLQMGNNFYISYAQNADLYLCNLKTTNGIPVLPFEIEITE